MKRVIEGGDRQQVTARPECLDDYIGEDNPVRVVDVFVEELDLHALDFEGVEPAVTGRDVFDRPLWQRSRTPQSGWHWQLATRWA